MFKKNILMILLVAQPKSCTKATTAMTGDEHLHSILSQILNMISRLKSPP